MALFISMTLLSPGILGFPIGAERSTPLPTAERRTIQRVALPLESGELPANAGQGLIKIAEPTPVKVKLEGLVMGLEPRPEGYALWVAYSPEATATEVLVTPDTTIRPIGAAPQLQDYVTVYALLAADETLTATYVRIRTEDEWVNQNQIEFRGLITAGPEGTSSPSALADTSQAQGWTIGGKTVYAEGKDFVGEPAVGKYAHVKGLMQRDGAIRATRVTVWDAAEVAAEFQFEGLIQAGPPAPGMWIIDGVEGQVDENTTIEGPAEVGAIAEVQGRRLPDGTIVFESIRVRTEEEREVRLEGLIEDYSITTEAGVIEGYLVIDQQEIQIDGMTFIDESGGRLGLNMWAEVIARREGRLLYALRVTISRPE